MTNFHISKGRTRPFSSQCCKMVRHTLKILQQMLQDFKGVSDHLKTLRSKGLIKSHEISQLASLV